MQQEGYSLPAPVLMAILSGKSIPWCWNLLWLLPHLPVAKDPERSQEAARESWQKHSWSSLGGNQGHNPTTNLVDSSWGLGNTFAGAKGQELETCSRKKPIHTHTISDTVGLRSRHQPSSPAPFQQAHGHWGAAVADPHCIPTKKPLGRAGKSQLQKITSS